MEHENTNAARKYSLAVFSLFALILSLSSASAHFVCGQVLNSPGNVSAAWMPVNVFYPATPMQFMTCRVSPQENKYCCDIESQYPNGSYVMGKAWTIGSAVSAEIYSPSTGYSAGPVSVVTTGNGYDAFPDMQLDKVINIFSPNSSIILSNTSWFLLNATFLAPYNSALLSNGTYNQTLCPNCTTFSGNISVQRGMNELTIYTFNGNNTGSGFSQNLDFALESSISSKQDITCRGCRNFPSSSVPQSREFNVTLQANLSDYAEGLVLQEYIPSDFNITNASGEIIPYSSSYNILRWNVSGKDISETYSLKSPATFRPRDYLFTAYLGGIEIINENVTVKNFFGIFPIGEEPPHYNYGYSVYPIVSPENPYVINNFSQGDLVTVGIFPNSTLNNTGFDVIPYIPSSKIAGALEYYLFHSNSRPNFYRTYVEFRVPKGPFVNASEISLFSYENGTWTESNTSFSGQDNGSYYFKGFVTGDSFAIVNSNSNAIYQLWQFIKRVFG